MTDQWETTDEPLVLHVIPTPRARGAQLEARVFADALDTPGVRAHRVLSLFAGPDEVAVDLALSLPDGDDPGAGFGLRAVPRLRSTLDRLDPAVVVAHGGEPLKYLVPAMLGRRRPLVYHAIGTYGASADRRAQLAVWRRLLRRVDLVTAVGDEVALECTGLLGVPPDRVVTTPNGRDPEVFHPRPPDGAGADDRPVVVFVGALTEGKGPDRFVEVVAGLRARGTDVRALLIGDGPLRAGVEAAAADAGVEVLGQRSDVAGLLGGADILVFASRPQGEGMPGVLIEAGMSGLAVVATDVPGVRSVIDDGTTGLVVPVDDASSMTGAVARLAGDRALRESMGAEARVRCVERFAIDVVAAQRLDAMAPLLPGAPPDRA